MRSSSVFQWEHSLRERIAVAEEILKDSADGEKIPVVVERVTRSDLEPIRTKEHGIPVNWTYMRFKMFVRRVLRLKPEETIVCIIDDTIPPATATMGDIYRNHAQEDKLLYCHYCEESVFG